MSARPGLPLRRAFLFLCRSFLPAENRRSRAGRGAGIPRPRDARNTALRRPLRHRKGHSAGRRKNTGRIVPKAARKRRFPAEAAHLPETRRKRHTFPLPHKESCPGTSAGERPRAQKKPPEGGFFISGKIAYLEAASARAATAGRVLPSSTSRNAPPPVDR